MDMRALKVGRKVTLSDALPGGGTSGVVIEVRKWNVGVQVAAQREGKDGAYCVVFDYDDNVVMFYDWTQGGGWDHSMSTESPISDLKIISSCD
jgi:hypothetical protein